MTSIHSDSKSPPQQDTTSSQKLVRVADRDHDPDETPGVYQILGAAESRIWGRDASDLLEQVLRKAGLEQRVAESEAFPEDGQVAIFRARYFFDRSAVELLIASPDSAIVESDDTGRIRLLAVRCAAAAAPRWRDLLRGDGVASDDVPHPIELLDTNSLPVVFDYELRRKIRPFVLRIGQDTRSQIEARTFALAYKGVTDVITKYVYPGPAFHATRLSARLGIKPNTVTAASLVLVIAVLYLFAEGRLAQGLAVGFFMSFLDTVDGKLARVTQTSSPFGKQFDHAIDQVHPPFWWLAWWWGAASVPEPGWWNAAAITCFLGYIALRLLEMGFKLRFGLRIHVWKRFDSRFRLFVSRRNTNLILLTIATLLGRPELGLGAVAVWMVVCLGVHGTRWIQADLERRRTGALQSWLETPQVA